MDNTNAFYTKIFSYNEPNYRINDAARCLTKEETRWVTTGSRLRIGRSSTSRLNL